MNSFAVKFIAILFSLLIAACTHVEKIPVQVPVEVKVPVMVPCIDAKELPALPNFATQSITGNEPDCELVDALLIERLQHQQYFKELNAVLAGCSDPKLEAAN